MPARKPVRRATSKAKPATAARKPAVKGKPRKTLPGAKPGKASPAKPALGAAPVNAYIASLPRNQRAIATRFDQLIGEVFPDIERGIKWGLAFYARDNGWFVSCGGFADCVKVNFLHGTELKPVPPVGSSKYVRSVDLHAMDEFDDKQMASWIRQASKFPGMGAKKH